MEESRQGFLEDDERDDAGAQDAAQGPEDGSADGALFRGDRSRLPRRVREALRYMVKKRIADDSEGPTYRVVAENYATVEERLNDYGLELLHDEERRVMYAAEVLDMEGGPLKHMLKPPTAYQLLPTYAVALLAGTYATLYEEGVAPLISKASLHEEIVKARPLVNDMRTQVKEADDVVRLLLERGLIRQHPADEGSWAITALVPHTFDIVTAESVIAEAERLMGAGEEPSGSNGNDNGGPEAADEEGVR